MRNTRQHRTKGYARTRYDGRTYLTEVYDNLPSELRRLLWDTPKQCQLVPNSRGRLDSVDHYSHIVERYVEDCILQSPYGLDHPQVADLTAKRKRDKELDSLI